MHSAVRPNPVAAALPTLLPERLPSFRARSRVIPVCGSACSQKYRTHREAKSSRKVRSSGLTGDESSAKLAALPDLPSKASPALEARNVRREKSLNWRLAPIGSQCRKECLPRSKVDETHSKTDLHKLRATLMPDAA